VCPTPARAREIAATFRAEGVTVVGVSLNPDTAVERLYPILDAVDLVLVMSVFPGFGGQKFMPETLDKTRALRARGYRGHIEMDGGLNAETAPACAAAGADVLVSGSYLFGAADLNATLKSLRRGAEDARKEITHAP
jgi:ribulose-phosphate 3-epimerase